jgi:hypothetical protein
LKKNRKKHSRSRVQGRRKRESFPPRPNRHILRKDAEKVLLPFLP